MSTSTDSSYKDAWKEILQVEKLRKTALKHARENFMEIYRSNEYLNSDKETLIKLLKSDNLQVDDEKIVFQCIVKWIEKNNPTSLTVLYDFLEAFRLPLLPIEFIIKQVLPYCYRQNLTLPFIDEALTWKLLPNKLTVNNRTNRRLVKLKNNFIVIGINNTSDTINKLELYNAKTNTWRSLKNFNINARQIGATLFNDRIIITGGLSRNKKSTALNTVREVDLQTGRMKSLSPMKQKRYGHQLITVGEGKLSTLYAIGGTNGTSKLNSVERWDSRTNEWTFVSPMKIPRRAFAAANLNDKIYVVGNYDDDQYDVEVYHTKEDKWEIKSPMKTTRGFCSAVFVGKSMYVMGGVKKDYSRKDMTKAFERYDTETNTWTTLADMLTGGDVGAGLIGDSPTAMGGGFGAYTTEKYDIEENKWIALKPMIDTRGTFPVIQLTSDFNDYKFDW